MGFFSKRTDCTLEEINLRLMGLESRPIRELKEIKKETATEVILELEKSEVRLGKKLTHSQQKLYHLIEALEKRIKTLEAKEHFNKTRKSGKK